MHIRPSTRDRKRPMVKGMKTIQKEAGSDPNEPFVVHTWDKYPAHSVLAGQPRKTFVDRFESLEKAKKAHPKAKMSHRMTEPEVGLDHLPDEDPGVPMW